MDLESEKIIDLTGDSSDHLGQIKNDNEAIEREFDGEGSGMNIESGQILNSDTGFLEDSNASSPGVIEEIRHEKDAEFTSQPDEPEVNKDGPNSTKEPKTGLINNISGAIVNDLEDQVTQLDGLLALKEKEWNAILRLKKHTEYTLDQAKCAQRMTKLQEGHNGTLSPADITACEDLIISNKYIYKYATRQSEKSIENTESDIESLIERSKSPKLFERKRKALDELTAERASRCSKLQILDARSLQSIPPQMQVVENGHQGATVVQSILQNQPTGDKSVDKQKINEKCYSVSSLNMGPDRKFAKILTDFIIHSMVEADNNTKDTPATAPSRLSSPIPVAPKQKKGNTSRPSEGTRILANPTPSSSGTFAKMSSPSTSTFTTDSETASFLATSNVEKKFGILKRKTKINARDDNTSQMSSQDVVPMCQRCNLTVAKFVCAACANSWYCSRECQVAAWEEHSEICTNSD